MLHHVCSLHLSLQLQPVGAACIQDVATLLCLLHQLCCLHDGCSYKTLLQVYAAVYSWLWDAAATGNVQHANIQLRGAMQQDAGNRLYCTAERLQHRQPRASCPAVVQYAGCRLE